MTSLTRFVIAHRRWVIAVWILLVLFGGFAAGKVADRFQTDFSNPGKPGFEANTRVFDAFGNGRAEPVQVVYTTEDGSDVTTNADIQASIEAVTKAAGTSRVSSFFNTDGARYFVSESGDTTYANVYPTGIPGFTIDPSLPRMEAALAKTTPDGVTANLTGLAPIQLSEQEDAGPGLLQEVIIGAFGALIVLLLIFGTLPAVLMPLMIAIASIMTTYAAVWGLSYLTDVSLIVQFLIGLVGLGIGIDYALLVIFRYREELARGTHDAPHSALIETMRHAGHSVIVSGSTVAIGLVSMVLLPVPFIRSIGLGGLLIPVVSVAATLTLLPAVLSIIGPRINRLRIPLLWRLANLDDNHQGRFWPGWAAFVVRRPWPVFVVGAVLIGILVSPAFDINPANSQVANTPGAGQAERGRDQLTKAGFPQGVFAPVQVVLERGASADDQAAVVAAVDGTKGVVGASAPEGWSAKGVRVVEVQQSTDPATDATVDTLDRVNAKVDDLEQSEELDAQRVTVAGAAASDDDFVHSVYDNFPYLLAFVVLLTFVLLARSLRSIVLPLKAVILNLLSLGAAYGVIVFVFQHGHFSHALWGFQATDSIVSWIPLMIFAFLFGISMDYEVFMLTRMREAYDAGLDTGGAVEVGLARTGKLVTSGAAILMFTFIVLSTGPGPDIKEFAIGLAAGIVIDATIIRVLLVPATVKLLGAANWWFPEWARKALLLKPAPPRGTATHVDEA
ncbi:MAG: MmpL protein [Thermoleophilia bacterium]|nr:MmpL protein [Thermoleophilia bacterium]